jgi:hypothetical protein
MSIYDVCTMLAVAALWWVFVRWEGKTLTTPPKKEDGK